MHILVKLACKSSYDYMLINITNPQVLNSCQLVVRNERFSGAVGLTHCMCQLMQSCGVLICQDVFSSSSFGTSPSADVVCSLLACIHIGCDWFACTRSYAGQPKLVHSVLGLIVLLHMHAAFSKIVFGYLYFISRGHFSCSSRGWVGEEIPFLWAL